MNIKPSSKEIWILIALFFSAVAFKAFLLFQRAAYIDPDEGYYLLLARNLVEGNGYTLNGLPNIVFPPFLPFMIAAVYFITHNLQLSLGLITAFSGGLLGIIMFKIAQDRFSSRFSILGAILVFFIYQLNAFIPISKPYIYTLYRGTETLNCLLIFAFLFLVIRMIQKCKLGYALGAGAAAACAYLTRPEGFILWALALVLLPVLKLTLLKKIPNKLIVALALIFIILSMPYLIYLKNVTGHWNLTGKYGLSQDYRDSLVKAIRSGDWEDFRQIHYAINSDLLEMNDYYFGYYEGEQPVKRGVRAALTNFFPNLSLSPIIPKILFPYPLALFFLIGFINAVIKIPKTRSELDIVLFSVFLYSISLAAVSYPMPRHHLYLVPVFCFYVLQGIHVSLIFLKRKMRKQLASFIIFSILFLTFTMDYLNFFNKSSLQTQEFGTSAAAERKVSDYLKKRNGKVVMTFYPAIAVKSFMDWQVLPKTDLFTVLKFAQKKKVDYIVLFDDYRYFFRVIDLENSIIPETALKTIYFRTVDRQPGFELVRLTEKEENNP